MYKINGFEVPTLEGVEPLRVASFTAYGSDIDRIKWNIHGVPFPSSTGVATPEFTWYGSDAQTIVGWLMVYD